MNAAAMQSEQENAQQFIENETELCAVLYQYAMGMNPSEKETKTIETLAYAVLEQLEKINSL